MKPERGRAGIIFLPSPSSSEESHKLALESVNHEVMNIEKQMWNWDMEVLWVSPERNYPMMLQTFFSTGSIHFFCMKLNNIHILWYRNSNLHSVFTASKYTVQKTYKWTTESIRKTIHCSIPIRVNTKLNQNKQQNKKP